MGVFMWYAAAVFAAGAGAGALAAAAYFRGRERRLLNHLEEMLAEGRDGRFRPGPADESMLSSVENSMNRFLEDSCVTKEDLALEGKDPDTHFRYLPSDGNADL